MTLIKEHIRYVDYKNVEFLKGFLGPQGNILSRRKTKTPALLQRRVEQAVKRARFMGLLPYVQK